MNENEKDEITLNRCFDKVSIRKQLCRQNMFWFHRLVGNKA
jgi:hypothetical protein